MNNRQRLGNILVNSGMINIFQLDEALELQRKMKDKKIGEILINLGYIKEEDLLRALSKQLGIPLIDLQTYKINSNALSLIKESMVRKYGILPIDIVDDELVLAISAPLDLFVYENLNILINKNIRLVLSEQSIIQETISKVYRMRVSQKVVKELEDAFILDELKDLDENDLSYINSAPVVKFVNHIIGQAVKMKASDIHIEPFKNITRVRIRIDGDLQKIMEFSIKSHMSIITRIKIMGKMDIAERRIPQDGRVEIQLDNKFIDIRISTLPTIYGEKVVIRLLDRESFSFLKGDLGLSDYDLKVFNRIIKQPHGIVLVTGPTGSGKTTTLYTILKDINKEEKNIITIENPIEYKLDTVNQVQVNYKAGLTFATGLRSILRQDPDIIMVGEIRDSETAEMAVRASITGHLVLSTLHTNNTVSSIIRLINMGIEPYMVSSSIVGIISQRLVKKLCDNCKVPYEASEEDKKIMNYEGNSLTIYKPKGCEQCIGGYRGRAPIFELLFVDKEIRELINSESTVDEIEDFAIKNGMKSLFKTSIELIISGVTSIEEILRINYTL